MDGEDFGSGKQRNVLGGMLIPCSVSPMTGFYRDGCCHTGIEGAPAAAAALKEPGHAHVKNRPRLW